ncbi:Leucine--tRNA ligase [Candidatus Annandia adelgestsuga]|uniref:Leucine--tRNA ligase n=1 Tax=Candidatus Annandia adelgestsuga TaxID=1302411 RepID=A0A3Q9CM20_9ENTR|nr:leucine--tRNA ligase [Candidatus Annandia adelgestsuga]AZP36357.1 Leucine--tRNA ligase [Candidatus Annandia adelgestsuga]
MQEKYIPHIIEKYVQKYWKKKKTFEVKEEKNKKKYYCLSMLPYPSGNLHIGHVRNYTISDVISKYHRMLGKNVLQPIGWDAFGLPAENAAIENNIEPKKWTYNNIYYMKKQLKKLGFGYDWSREITTCDSKYYRWEQWFFIKLYKKKLVYKKKTKVYWCKFDKTVLANEQVINNRCWRCNNLVFMKKISQWFIKITKYANKLLKGLKELKYWPEKVKIMQKNWIGKSKFIKINFNILNKKKKIKIYTKNPSKIIGTTYILLSIDHSLSKYISIKNKKIYKFIKIIKKLKNIKYPYYKLNNIGINTNLFAINPFDKSKIPIWISNFLLNDYNIKSAISISAHNKKDFIFSKKYSLNIKRIFKSNDKKYKLNLPYVINKNSIICNSFRFNNLNLKNINNIITDIILIKKIGNIKYLYRLKDWGVSRQRYWGTPIPMITNKLGIIKSIPEKFLPVLLPKYDKNKKKKKNNKIIINNKIYFKEKDTFDTFMESSWYYIRYTCSKFNNGMVDSKKANYWLPVDQYVGGIEHATMHLIYFRFYHKLLKDAGLIKSKEPVKKLLCQGMVVNESFYILKNKIIKWISYKDLIIKRDKKNNIIKAYTKKGIKVFYAGISKMSKSKKNGVDPQKIISKYGADTLRMFIMFAAPVCMKLKWNDNGIKGIYKFLNKIWIFIYNHINFKNKNKIIKKNIYDYKIKLCLNKTIKKVSIDIEKKQSFNTAISSIMILFNKIIKISKIIYNYKIIQKCLLVIIKLIYPFTPHLSFYLWKKINNVKKIDDESWPSINDKSYFKENILIIIQINGKFKNKIFVSNNISKKILIDTIFKKKIIYKNLKKKKILKIIYINNKVINFIIK